MVNTTKAHLIAEAAERTGISMTDCKVVLDMMLKSIPEFLMRFNGDATVELRGFGIFCLKIRKPRPARNPHTGEIVNLPQRRVLLWKASPNLNQIIQHQPPSFNINHQKESIHDLPTQAFQRRRSTRSRDVQ